MKKICILLVLIMILPLSACGNDKDKKSFKKTGRNEIVEDAISELTDCWEDVYSEPNFEECDGYFEIKNTRLIKLKKNDIELFEDIEYIIEFDLYSDYFGSAPYYSNVGAYNNVLVYENGTMEVDTSMINNYRAMTFKSDFSDFIDSIEDYGSEYNCVEKLK